MQLHFAVSNSTVPNEEVRVRKTGKAPVKHQDIHNIHMHYIYIDMDRKHHRTCRNLPDWNFNTGRGFKSYSGAHQHNRHLAKPHTDQHHCTYI